MEKAKVEEQVHSRLSAHALTRITDLEQARRRIRNRVLNAECEDLSLLCNALQIQVHVEGGRGELRGIIPEYAPKENHTDVRAVVARRGSSSSTPNIAFTST